LFLPCQARANCQPGSRLIYLLDPEWSEHDVLFWPPSFGRCDGNVSKKRKIRLSVLSPKAGYPSTVDTRRRRLCAGDPDWLPLPSCLDPHNALGSTVRSQAAGIRGPVLNSGERLACFFSSLVNQGDCLGGYLLRHKVQQVSAIARQLQLVTTNSGL